MRRCQHLLAMNVYTMLNKAPTSQPYSTSSPQELFHKYFN